MLAVFFAVAMVGFVRTGICVDTAQGWIMIINLEFAGCVFLL